MRLKAREPQSGIRKIGEKGGRRLTWQKRIPGLSPRASTAPQATVLNLAGRLTASPDAGSAEAMDIAAALALLILDMPSPALFKRSDHDRTRLSSASNFS